MIFLSLPFAAILVFFSRPIILIFSKSLYLPASNLFPILALGSILYGCGNLLLSSLYAIKKPKINRDISLVSASIFLILSTLLTYYFSALGLSVAYALSVFIMLLLSFFFLKRYLTLVLPWKSIFKVILSTAVLLVVFFVLDALTYNTLIKLTIALLVSPVYLLALIPLRFYEEEDVKLVKLLAAKAPVFKKQLLSISNFLSKYT